MSARTTFISGLIALAVTLLYGAALTQGILGDVNDDGKVDGKDALRILRIAADDVSGIVSLVISNLVVADINSVDIPATGHGGTATMVKLQNDNAPCPECGGTSKTYQLVVQDRIGASEGLLATPTGRRGVELTVT